MRHGAGEGERGNSRAAFFLEEALPERQSARRTYLRRRVSRTTGHDPLKAFPSTALFVLSGQGLQGGPEPREASGRHAGEVFLAAVALRLAGEFLFALLANYGVASAVVPPGFHDGTDAKSVHGWPSGKRGSSEG